MSEHGNQPDGIDYDDFRKMIDDFAQQSNQPLERPQQLSAEEEMLQTLRSLPSQEQGIHTKRVERFLRKHNLRHCEYFVLNFADIPQRLRIMIEKEPTGGIYVRGLNAVIIVRDFIEKRGYPKEGMEAVLVHELAHSSGGEKGFLGSMPSHEEEHQDGIFFEEGFADVFESEYFAKYGNVQDVKTKDAPKNISMESVLVRSAVTQANTNSSGDDYVYFDVKRGWNATRSSYAGFGLEILCKAIPALKKTLIKGRSDPKYFQNALALIDTHFPGLSEKLMELKETGAAFGRGNNLILQAVYGESKPNLNSRLEPVVQNVTSLRYRISKALGRA